MIVLENEGFRVEINPFGAELTSFRSKTTGTEYVWGGDPAAWKRHAPVLFPIVGRLKDKTYTVGGASFEITVENPEHVEKGVKEIWLDGEKTDRIPICEAGSSHTVRVVMG